MAGFAQGQIQVPPDASAVGITKNHLRKIVSPIYRAVRGLKTFSTESKIMSAKLSLQKIWLDQALGCRAAAAAYSEDLKKLPPSMPVNRVILLAHLRITENLALAEQYEATSRAFAAA